MGKPNHTMLAQIRRAAGKTQQQIADELGVGKTTYSAWETGRAELGAERILALCESLGCTPNDILGVGDDSVRFARLTSSEEEAVDLLRRLPPNIREDLLDIMRSCVKGWRAKGR